MLSSINNKLGTAVTLEGLKKMADRCLADEWLERNSMAGKYGQLSLTASGLGVVRSKQRQREALSNRTAIKCISDYIVDHKGIFIALGALIALGGLLVRVYP